LMRACQRNESELRVEGMWFYPVSLARREGARGYALERGTMLQMSKRREHGRQTRNSGGRSATLMIIEGLGLRVQGLGFRVWGVRGALGNADDHRGFRLHGCPNSNSRVHSPKPASLSSRACQHLKPLGDISICCVVDRLLQPSPRTGIIVRRLGLGSHRLLLLSLRREIPIGRCSGRTSLQKQRL
jgi:hypothetical protein